MPAADGPSVLGQPFLPLPEEHLPLRQLVDQELFPGGPRPVGFGQLGPGQGTPHVYLGYFVDGCASLEYKARFRPNEVLGADGEWGAFRD